jgi:hypothetical protein
VSWERVVLEELRYVGDLPARITALFEDQRRRWPALRDGEASLGGLRTRILRDGPAWVVAQANPGRRRSIQAAVDPASIAQRPCFLCPEHMPPEERGVDFGELVILPNPYPILARHCTVPIRRHIPQRLAGQVISLLDLARAAGPELLVFYNGPRCGASAPDHFHLQICLAAPVPLLGQLPLGATGRERLAVESFGRRMIVAADPDPEGAADHLRHALEELAALAPDTGEPMISLLVLVREGRWITVLFPRRAHRPACFFAAGEQRLAVSPAALEMAGLLVVAEPDHLDRMDAGAARTIYQEVSLDAGRFSALAKAVT